ncbi:hypothetical protein MKY91_03785 [Alkalicoccobacillus gibsonii]|uniref:DUF2254 domain-containing protein n=1 Tax=Alkalicoccobacillus gibsonii TaxID=79881 RepID=A0ABU9VEG3_9BACI
MKKKHYQSLNELKRRVREFKRKNHKKYRDFKTRTEYTTSYRLHKFLLYPELILLACLVIIVIEQMNLYNFPYLSNLSGYFNENEGLISLNTQLLFSQVSVTFIILSLLTLTTNLKKEQVFGTSVYRIIFTGSVISNITILSFIIFLLLFVNIYTLMFIPSMISILPVFIMTLILLSLFILKIICFTNNKFISINKVAGLYYGENKKTIIKFNKNRMRFRYKSDFLYDLKEDTIVKILKNDIEYKKNFHVFKVISYLSLSKYKYAIQENHTEDFFYKDTLSIWDDCIVELIANQLYSEAIYQYNNLVSLLIDNEVYLTKLRINNHLKEIFIGLSSSKSNLIFEQNKLGLMRAIILTMKYGFYKANNDFSYTRLGKDAQIYYPNLYGNLLNDYYDIIDKKIEVNRLEKSKQLIDFFETLRTESRGISRRSVFDLKRNDEYNYDKYRLYNYSNEFEGDLSLLGFPLSQLIIQLIQEDKKSRLEYFYNYFNDNSIYFACLIVATKLVGLMDSRNSGYSKEDKVIDKHLKYVLSKLKMWDGYSIKFNCNIINKSVTEYLSIYDTINLGLDDLKHLDIVKQALLMSKHQIEISKISESQPLLRDIYGIVCFTEENLLTEMKEEVEMEYINEFGILNFMR